MKNKRWLVRPKKRWLELIYWDEWMWSPNPGVRPLHTEPIKSWLDEQEIAYRFHHDKGNRCWLIFSDPKDAMLYKLRWRG